MRRLTQDELDTLRRRVGRGQNVLDSPSLIAHLVEVSREALRKAGPIPRDAPYDDAASGLNAFVLEKQGTAILAALRETTTPTGFADYMRRSLRNYYIDVGRRQKLPRLYDRTAALLTANEAGRYACLEHNRSKRLRWWGRAGWPADSARHRHETDALRAAGERALEPLELVRDRPDKQYAPKLLGKPALNDLVSGTLDGVGEALTLEHYAWLFPILFPIEYRRIDAESLEQRAESMGSAGEIAVTDLIDARGDMNVLEGDFTLETALRMVVLHRHRGDAEAAADELGADPEELLGERLRIEQHAHRLGLSFYDLNRVLDRMSELV